MALAVTIIEIDSLDFALIPSSRGEKKRGM